MFRIEVDILGNDSWASYKTIMVPAEGYTFHVFPDGYSAQWVKVVPLQDLKNATVHFVYY